MSEPKKPGWWWAKVIDSEDGDPDWQIVRIVRLGVRDDFMVERLDGGDSDFLEAFTFGPEVTKPEGLE